MMWNFASNAIASIGWKKETLKPSHVCSEAVDDDHCSNVSREEGLECPICCESFNIVENVPYVLWCGHTLCKNCVMGLQWAFLKLPNQTIQIPFFISCPWCHFLSLRLIHKGNLKFPSKNYFLLSLVESLNADKSKAFSSFSTDYQPLCSPNASLLENHASNSNFQRVPWSPRSGYMELYSYGRSRMNGHVDVDRHHHSHQAFFDHFIHFTSKLPLVLMLLLIVFFVVPSSTAILALYLLLTVLVAIPSFLVLYFTCLILGWLMREISA